MIGIGKPVIPGLLVVMLWGIPLQDEAQDTPLLKNSILQDVDLVGDALRVSITISQMREDVTAPMDVHVRIVNRSGKDVTLKKVEMLMPAEFLAARGEKDPEAKAPGQLLNPGRSQFISFGSQR